ncbi:beta-galactosidase [Zymobacter palmae]|uniref:Beta-galactosidase n=1 Tax=Zymobacter palmae TaxID=33074 RepID=A0A348HDL4_9GAMM|nr:beta-galactosidase [Zymobacter palmae]
MKGYDFICIYRRCIRQEVLWTMKAQPLSEGVCQPLADALNAGQVAGINEGAVLLTFCDDSRRLARA